MPVPEDTSQRDPLVHLAGAWDNPTRYIEEQEKAGQAQLVNSTVLPIDTRHSDQAFVDLGFTFGDKVDDLFRDATLPDGWSKKGSDHSMGSYVVDERDIERVSIFYKAAFYDRSANMHLVNVGRNLSTKAIYGDEPDEVPWSVLTDDEKADFLTGLADYLARAEESPSVYGDRVPKVEALVAQYGGES